MEAEGREVEVDREVRVVRPTNDHLNIRECDRGRDCDGRRNRDELEWEDEVRAPNGI